MHQDEARAAAAQRQLERRRKANRERQREYRRLDLEELATLKCRAATLEQQWAALTVHAKRDVMAMLPWQDVAAGLGDDAALAKTQNQALRDQIHAYGALGLSSSATGWRSVTLPADDAARCHAADWLTQRLYHNVDGTFQSNRFPPAVSLSDEPFYDIHVHLDDGLFQFVVRSQRVVPVGLAHAAHLFRAFDADVENVGIENSTGNWVARVDEPLFRDELPTVVYGRQTLIKGVEQHYLCRQFAASADRIVVVGQNIVQDDKYPTAQTRGMYEETGWRSIDRLSETACLVRDCITVTPLRTSDGYLSLDAYAEFFGVEADMEREHLTVPNFRRRLTRFFGYIDRDLRDYMTPDIEEAVADKNQMLGPSSTNNEPSTNKSCDLSNLTELAQIATSPRMSTANLVVQVMGSNEIDDDVSLF
ncbi:Aste57867_1161 [Aphanomyces stellatus]|uniref:Aste57867_1161 protein n=1 Tax=Aphanomyces stellatus TaxID=120398 RepID=A0A485K4Y7_9STRA|nr:hypothetical protein As57867_001160 [Aphanomyces stellatus]VFT78381.1 Aste57867_1161 [Aphanomyces stellatus]